VFGYTETTNCHLTCTLHAAGNCGGVAFSSPDLSMQTFSPWKISAKRTNEGGYKHQVCVQCTNGVQTENLYNFEISQSPKVSSGSLSDVQLDYSTETPVESIPIDPAEVFKYTGGDDFPITSCTLHAAGDCGGIPYSSSDLEISGSAPWVISAKRTVSGGYHHEVCVQCSNGV
jgi:hypothetical protein